MKRGSTFATLDLFETQSVINALGIQIRRIDEMFPCLPKAQRLEVRVLRQRLVTLHDRLKKRFDPAIEKLREDARAPISQGNADAR